MDINLNAILISLQANYSLFTNRNSVEIVDLNYKKKKSTKYGIVFYILLFPHIQNYKF